MPATQIVIYERSGRLCRMAAAACAKQPVSIRQVQSRGEFQQCLELGPFPVAILDGVFASDSLFELLQDARMDEAILVVFGSEENAARIRDAREWGALWLSIGEIEDPAIGELLRRLVGKSQESMRLANGIAAAPGPTSFPSWRAM